MIRNLNTLSLVALLLLVTPQLSFADETSLDEGRPKEEAFRTILKKETSTLNIPIEMTTEELAKVLNQSVHKDLYKGSTKTSGLTADVVRNGPLAATASGNYLYVTIPVTMSLSYGMFETPAIPLKLKFKATAGVTPDWRLHTEVHYMGLSDLLAEDIGIGPLSLKPRGIVEGIVQPVQNMLSDLVTQKVNTLVPLKSLIAKAWNTAQKPILLDKNYGAWLKLTPREVMMFPLTAQSNRVRLSIGISTFAELVVGPEPAAQPLIPLPNLKLVKSFDKTFRIALNADIFYKDLRAAVAPLLLDKQFDSDGKSIIIKDFDLYGNGDRIVVKLETRGSLDGVFYLTAKPVFYPKTSVFSVEDVDFDMKTKDVLLKTADWFLHGTIRNMIKDKLNLNLSRQLDQSRQMAGKALAHVQLMKNMYLKCDIKNLKLCNVVVQKDKISIQVYTEGESLTVF
jgi:Domain of unknown function (DUF4403)